MRLKETLRYVPTLIQWDLALIEIAAALKQPAADNANGCPSLGRGMLVLAVGNDDALNVGCLPVRPNLFALKHSCVLLVVRTAVH
jgi:hypothetical protein